MIILFGVFFDQINAAVVSIRVFFQKHLKKYQPQILNCFGLISLFCCYLAFFLLIFLFLIGLV